MQDPSKIVKSLKDSGILFIFFKKQKGCFSSMILGTLGASLLGDLLKKKLSGRGVIRAGEGTIRAGYRSENF